MVNHHQVFNNFKCWQGEVKAGFIHDFLGTMTRTKYFSLMSSPEYEKTRSVKTSYPLFDEEYFEWIDLLEAVINAKDSFTMIELGAGWGRWLCRAVGALRQYNRNLPYCLLGVEAESTHYRWMIEHFQDNNIDLSRCKLLEAAVSDKDGSCRFFIGDAYNSYGQSIATHAERDGNTKEVKSVSLQTLLQDLDRVDLIDLDVQGSELSVLSAVPKDMWDKVKRVHIGTHSGAVEKRLRRLFARIGWRKKYDFPAHNVLFTHYGWISFQDGVQSWVNPKYIKSDDLKSAGTTPLAVRPSHVNSVPNGKWSRTYSKEVSNSSRAFVGMEAVSRESGDTKPEPLLSVVVVSRNDDHGGNLLHRMQLFVSGWLEQAKRHNLDSELVIVEWNPLPDRPRLAQALKWPKDNGLCTVRIIEVPPEIHQRFKYSDRLPLFQMIGKNVGIRRARGRFILATNIDILFSNELMQYFASGQMVTGRMYRVDRYDVPSDIPSRVSIDEQLSYCREHVIRINSRAKTLISEKTNTPSGESVSVFHNFQERVKALRNAKGVCRLGKDIFLYACSLVYGTILRPILYDRLLHTNACGDFTLMAREYWLALRGNAEFEMFSFYLDGLMCAVAHYGGARELILAEPMRIYHIEHAPGSGWSPGVGAKMLDERLKTTGIPRLTYKEYLKYLRRIRWHHGPTILNDVSWGLGQESLKEYTIIKGGWDKA